MDAGVHPHRLVELSGAGVRRGGRWLVEGVDLAIHRGEIVTLIGPNGSGKSTTARLATGVLRPDAGSAVHDHALVNRYAVDEVSADLMLGFFFPGAHYPPGADPATGVVATAG